MNLNEKRIRHLIKKALTENYNNIYPRDYHVQTGADKIATGLYLGTLSDGFQKVLEKFEGFDNLLDLDDMTLASVIELIVALADKQTMIKDIEILNKMIDDTLKEDISELEEKFKKYENMRHEYIRDYAARRHGGVIEFAKKDYRFMRMVPALSFSKSMRRIKSEIDHINSKIKKIEDKLITPLNNSLSRFL